MNNGQYRSMRKEEPVFLKELRFLFSYYSIHTRVEASDSDGRKILHAYDVATCLSTFDISHKSIIYLQNFL
jgi:DUF1009 family protein